MPPLTPTYKGGEFISCFHPLYMYKTKSINIETGKNVYKIIPADRYRKLRKDFVSDYDFDLYVNADPDLLAVPCKKCIGCRLDYAREWACRCMLELKSHDSAFFLTLTYDDAKIMLDDGKPENLSDSTKLDYGKAKIVRKNKAGFPVLSLKSDSFTKFMKRLRKEYDTDKIRFFGCGEYGSTGFRPHYHLIVFGLHLDDLVEEGQNRLGDKYYNSARLSSVWPYGFITIGHVTFQSAAYVARYTAKKSNVLGDDFYRKENIEPPFIRMSRRPGIGKSYLDEHPEIWESSHIFIPKRDGVASFSIPQYYYRCLEKVYPELCADLKEQKAINGNLYQRTLIMSSQKSYEKTMEDAEKIIKEKGKTLARKLNM